jgi:hypothetical protein
VGYTARISLGKLLQNEGYMGTDRERQESGQGEAQEYAKPTIVDHGDLQELTAHGGSTLSDVAIGAPVAATCAP